jgi:hypothetical protein
MPPCIVTSTGSFGWQAACRKPNWFWHPADTLTKAVFLTRWVASLRSGHVHLGTNYNGTPTVTRHTVGLPPLDGGAQLIHSVQSNANALTAVPLHKDRWRYVLCTNQNPYFWYVGNLMAQNLILEAGQTTKIQAAHFIQRVHMHTGWSPRHQCAWTFGYIMGP